MGSVAEELEVAALSLPRAERARIAERMLARLDDEAEVEETWRDEVRRRLEAYHRGQMEAVSASEVLEEGDRLSK